MTAFSRAILPAGATYPKQGGPLISASQNGSGQFRSIQQLSRAWTETYGVASASSAVTRAFLTEVNHLWRNGTVFDTYHPLLKTLLGAGGGTPLVDGASQIGSSLVTDGWPFSTTVLKAGDVIRIAGLNLVYDVTTDVLSNGSGQAAIPISPAIYAGQSPANNAAITINSTPGLVVFRCRFLEPKMPDSASAGLHVAGLELTFWEQVL